MLLATSVVFEGQFRGLSVLQDLLAIGERQKVRSLRILFKVEMDINGHTKSVSSVETSLQPSATY